jgi:recombination protein RecA
LAQGRDGSKAVVRDNPELAAELEAKIVEAIQNK